MGVISKIPLWKHGGIFFFAIETPLFIAILKEDVDMTYEQIEILAKMIFGMLVKLEVIKFVLAVLMHSIRELPNIIRNEKNKSAKVKKEHEEAERLIEAKRSNYKSTKIGFKNDDTVL